MIALLQSLFGWFNTLAGWLFFAGLLLVVAYNWRVWQADQRLAKEYAQKSRSPVELKTTPPVSLLVAAWNEAENIEAFIRSFRALRYPRKELILCAGGRDETYHLACRMSGPDVTVIEQLPGMGKQRSLRRCLDLAQGEILFLTDADSILQDESFERTLSPVINEGEAVCTGASHASLKQLAHPFVASQTISQLYAALHAPRYAPGLFGRNCALTREAALRSGGFDALAPTGTDYVLAKMLDRAGMKIRQEPLSRMISQAPVTLRGYFRQQRRWLYNVFSYGQQFGAKAEARSALQSALIGLAMLLMPLGALVFGPIVLTLWGFLIAHVLFSRFRYLSVAYLAIDLPLTFQVILFQPLMMFIDFAAWAVPLWDFARQKKGIGW